MVRVTVDLSELRSLTLAAEGTVDHVGDVMRAAADAAVRTEVRSHAYRNITGNLEASTVAGPATGGDPVIVEVGALMPYASAVENRGRSRMTELCERAGARIERNFKASAERLANRGFVSADFVGEDDE